MAGTDFVVEFGGAQERVLVQRLLRHLQQRAKHYGLKLRFRHQRGMHEYLVVVDGPLRGMQAFAPRLTIEALVCAEFADDPKPAWRRTDLAHDLVSGYHDAVARITDGVLSLHRRLSPIVGPDALEGDLAAPLSFVFDRTGVPTHLHGPIARFETTLAVYAAMPVDLLPDMVVGDEQVLEEAHTMTELLLRTSTGEKRFSYKEMADRAREREWVTTEQHRLLLKLKDARRDTKHKGRGVGLFAGRDMVLNAVACSHQLLAQIAGRAWW